jgi:hypothetical protein
MWRILQTLISSSVTTADSLTTTLDGIDEVEGYLLAGLSAIVIAYIAEIGRCELAESDGLDHLCSVAGTDAGTHGLKIRVVGDRARR